ncbi:TadE/TadG family type IV pilus assembly protein [Litorimonas sp.]|uniref:TadE/TadG family type IV pilus assembly protein n=1 Tax=Litorimonas sp. TaxID=1892381 RepID=UPI003A83A88E
MNKKLTLKTRLQQSVSGIRKNEDGLAAIEFAILAPLLISMYFGLAEIASAVAVDRSVSHATNVIGDLASQTSNIDKEDLEDVLSATIRVMNIENASGATIQIDSWARDSDGKNTLVGSAVMNNGSASLPSFDPASVDNSMMNENSGIVVARIAYNYTPLKFMYMKQDFTMSDTFILKPRRSTEVTFGSASGKSFSCTASGRTVSCS